MPQIMSKMLPWNAARLSEGYPSPFGELLGYARHLGFDEPVDYERFRTVFEKLPYSEVETKRGVNFGKIFMRVGPEDALIVINRSEARSSSCQRISTRCWRSRSCSN